MSYQTGTATDIDDLITKLDAFITGTPGWTQLLLDTTNNRAGWSKLDSDGRGWTQYTYMNWDSTNIKHHGSKNAPGSPIPTFGTYLDPAHFDSRDGQGFTNGMLTNLGVSGPFPAYHFFEDDDYVHVVLEYSSGLFRHFGFGRLALVGNRLRRGEYVYNAYWDTGNSADNAAAAVHQNGMGCLYYNSTGRRGHRLLIEDYANGESWDGSPQPVWHANMVTDQPGSQGDGLGLVQPALRSYGGSGHPQACIMGIGPSQFDGYVPLYPNFVMSKDVDVTPDTMRLIGYVKDTYTVNIRGFEPGEEITIGGDTYVVFPQIRKTIPNPADNTAQSGSVGYAYKKVTT
jgi:hypothetical protein